MPVTKLMLCLFCIFFCSECIDLCCVLIGECECDIWAPFTDPTNEILQHAVLGPGCSLTFSGRCKHECHWYRLTIRLPNDPIELMSQGICFPFGIIDWVGS